VTARAPVTRAAAELARELRHARKNMPWREIVDELARLGHGRVAPGELAEAVWALPAATHPLAPPTDEAIARLERCWRIGWQYEFPGQPWPGLIEAKRLIHAKIRVRPTGEGAR
jgi:hypothetical protein